MGGEWSGWVFNGKESWVRVRLFGGWQTFEL